MASSLGWLASERRLIKTILLFGGDLFISRDVAEIVSSRHRLEK